MVASLLTGQPPSPEFAELLRPEPLPDGTDPEERLIICGISKYRCQDLDKALGDDRSGPRCYFLDGDLEIMTTSNEHERVKKWIGGFLDIYFDETGTEIMPRGQATMRQALKQAGAEPDESWCLGEEKEFPDWVLEIALTSGAVSKSSRLQAPEKHQAPSTKWRRCGSIHELGGRSSPQRMRFSHDPR